MILVAGRFRLVPRRRGRSAWCVDAGLQQRQYRRHGEPAALGYMLDVIALLDE